MNVSKVSVLDTISGFEVYPFEQLYNFLALSCHFFARDSVPHRAEIVSDNCFFFAVDHGIDAASQGPKLVDFTSMPVIVIEKTVAFAVSQFRIVLLVISHKFLWRISSLF